MEARRGWYHRITNSKWFLWAGVFGVVYDLLQMAIDAVAWVVDALRGGGAAVVSLPPLPGPVVGAAWTMMLLFGVSRYLDWRDRKRRPVDWVAGLVTGTADAEVPDDAWKRQTPIPASLEEMVATKSGHRLSIDNDRIAEKYVGKVKEVAVEVWNIREIYGGVSLQGEGNPHWLLWFSDPKEEARVRTLSRGAKIRAAGRVRSIESSYVTLEDCWLLD